MARSTHITFRSGRSGRSGARKRALPQYGAEPTKVLTVGNSQRFIEQISNLLAGESRIKHLGGAQGRIEAAERLVLLKPDVVVIEIDLDYELGGIDTAFALRRISPNTAFVLISPYTDAERLAMVPRGLGLEWSYVLTDGEIDRADLVTAVSSAGWSIPFIDSRIDRSRLGRLQDTVEDAVDLILRTSNRTGRLQNRWNSGQGRSNFGYSGSADWSEQNGRVQKFRLPDDDSGDGPGSGE